MLSGLIVFCGFYLLGEFIAKLLGWPIPGSVLGMLGLFLVMLVSRTLPGSVEKSASRLLPYLPLFIVPASVGIVNYADLLQQEGLMILLAIVISLVVGIPFCGWIMQKMIGGQR